MKIKLDENLPIELVGVLHFYSHDVDTVPSEGLSGADDGAIFSAAGRDSRLLMTQDLDFADIRKFRPGTHPGIVIIRLRDPSRRRLVERIRHVLHLQLLDSWANCFVVIGDRKLRVRRP